MTLRGSPVLSNQFWLLPTTRQPIPPNPPFLHLTLRNPILQEVRSHKAVAWFRLCNFKIISLITRILLFWMLVKSLGDHTINITSSIISVEASCVVWSLWLKPALCNHKCVAEFLQFQPCLAQGGGRIVPPCHVFACICVNTRMSLLKKLDFFQLWVWEIQFCAFSFSDLCWQ